MKNNSKIIEFPDQKEPVCLHIELDMNGIDEDELKVIKEFGGLKYGKAISRDILIPYDMHLNALHYVIQELFGWESGHMRDFKIEKKDFKRLIQDKLTNWLFLIGCLLKIPVDYDTLFLREDLYDDYIFSDDWLADIYNGPYKYEGNEELYSTCKNFTDCFKKELQAVLSENKSIEECSFKGLIVDNHSYGNMIIYDNLLESLEVTSVLAQKGQRLNSFEDLGKKMVKRKYQPRSRRLSPEMLPVTHKLIYDYDYGDDWRVYITRPKNFDTLIKSGLITADDFENAKKTVSQLHKPVCLFKDGGPVLDDVGGVYGYYEMLKVIFVNKSKKARTDMLKWAYEQGWELNNIDAPIVL